MMASPTIRLVPLPLAAMKALVAGERGRASELTGVDLPSFFSEERMIWLCNYRINQIETDPASAEWLVRVVVSEPEGEVVGHAGFHGPPDENGMVEVGYSVVPEFRRRGFAKAIVRALLERASSEPDVAVVRASISPDNEASLATIAGFGFTRVGEQWDDEDGRELLFELPVPVSGNSKGAQ
ncbi:MAG TPA: GNAT family protein [Homoserinimonas sp.]|nr:GNAT family protein [Homoserinimonas sp.]